jgi:hypothetical protein
MKGTHPIVAVAVAVLFGSGCGDGRAVVDPGASETALRGSLSEAPALAGLPTPAAGEFQAEVDFGTLTYHSQGNHCIVQVEGSLSFTGTLVGDAPGMTTARIFASCEEVLANPPGTFPDVFRSELEFDGTVNGLPAQASMVYHGRAAAGGQIDARILLSDGLQGVLHADAQLAVGGSYTGFVIMR